MQNRRGDERLRLPYIVRWSIDGRQRSRSFRTKAEAERFRVELLKAAQVGDRFDLDTGEPASWSLPLADLGVHQWVRRWLAEQWPEWQPRTRASAVEALARFTSLAVKPRADIPEDLRRYLTDALAPDTVLVPDRERWLDRNCLALGELDRETVADLARRLSLKLDGEPLAASTSNRYRTNAHACVLAAVEAGAIPADPWPKRSKSRARRKVSRPKAAVDVRSLPDPATMAKAIAAMENRQPGSKVYRAMTAVAYYAGLRPSEVMMLRVRSLTLPEQGWGRIDVTEADISWDEPGEPKTGPRRVPIPPVLVDMLRQWVGDNDLSAPDELLFRTAKGTRPSTSNWGRAWHRALESIGQPPLRVYDCRHAAATTWLRAGVPLGETARRLGHSVETLVGTYVGALEGDEELGNQRIEAELRIGAAARSRG
ncbi:MAG: tyrosine-type recombinase/integrase [Acidimicrobiales bacterium]